MNIVNRLRVEMGLSRPKMLELLGLKQSNLALFSLQDEQIDPEVIVKAKALREAYRDWVNSIETKLSEYQRRGALELTSSEVHDLIGLKDLHIAQLRKRKVIPAIRHGYEYGYPLAMLRELVESNSEALVSGNRYRGPLSYGFLRWLGRRNGIAVDLAVSGRSQALREPALV